VVKKTAKKEAIKQELERTHDEAAKQAQVKALGRGIIENNVSTDAGSTMNRNRDVARG